jgi:hypothetical protein
VAEKKNAKAEAKERVDIHRMSKISAKGTTDFVTLEFIPVESKDCGEGKTIGNKQKAKKSKIKNHK